VVFAGVYEEIADGPYFARVGSYRCSSCGDVAEALRGLVRLSICCIVYSLSLRNVLADAGLTLRATFATQPEAA